MSKIQEHISKSEKATEEIAKSFLELIDAYDVNVVGMVGELGAGKTRFVKYVASALGVKETVNSPTFLIMKNYDISDSRFSRLYHFDWYRIETAEEIHSLGWSDISKNKNNLIFVEWADKIQELLPENHIKIFFEVLDENARKIIFKN